MKCRPNAVMAQSIKRGFTLIELLVVVSIIALLVSILLPALSKAREQGYAVKCMSNFKQIGLATMLYLEDNDEYFPAADGWSSAWLQLLGSYVDAEKNDLSRQVGQGEDNVFTCPSNRSPNRATYRDYMPAWGHPTSNRYGLIGYNVVMNKYRGESKRLNHIEKRHAEVIWLVEAANDGGVGGDGYIYYYSMPNQAAFQNQFGFRHSGKGHVVFVDWHVENRSQDKGYSYEEFCVR